MGERWRIDFDVWPYSGVQRPCPEAEPITRDEPMRGARAAHVYVDAADFADATKQASAVRAGVLLDERVWQARITGVARERPTHPAALQQEDAA